MPVHKAGIKPYNPPIVHVGVRKVQNAAIERSQGKGNTVQVDGSNSMACVVSPVPTANKRLVYVYQRVNCTWVDLDNRYPALPFECSKVMHLVPGSTTARLVTGPTVPRGYRRWEVR